MRFRILLRSLLITCLTCNPQPTITTRSAQKAVVDALPTRIPSGTSAARTTNWRGTKHEAGRYHTPPAGPITPGNVIVPTDNSSGVSSAPAAGQFAVSPDGAATYTYPIWVPQGRRGIQPSLGFNYNSRHGNGSLGVGWSLQGLSSITRCKRDIARDGHNEAIQYDGDDAFCLDGERLVAVSNPVTGASAGTYGAEGTEYRTEEDHFVRIINGPNDGNGPISFKVETKDGRRLLYGTTQDSRLEGPRSNSNQTVRLSWALAEVRDLYGNNMTMQYMIQTSNTNTWAGTSFVIQKILYTGTLDGSLQPQRAVIFNYDEGLPASVAGVAVTSGGSGYINPQVTLLGGGSPNPGSASATVVGGVITNITVTSAGSGYTSAPSVYIHDQMSRGGQGASATAILTATGTRPDVAQHFVAGLQLADAHLLTSIDLSAPTFAGTTQIVKTYKLEYQAGSSGRSLLSQISECDASSICLVPTVFTYSQQTDGFIDEDTHISAPSGSYLGPIIVGDLNGDGCDDFIYTILDNKLVFHEAHYVLSPCYDVLKSGAKVIPNTSNQLSPPVAPYQSPSAAIFVPNDAYTNSNNCALAEACVHNQLLALDFDLDGRVDLLHYNVVNKRQYPNESNTGIGNPPGQDFTTDLLLASVLPPAEWAPSSGLYTTDVKSTSNAIYYEPGYPQSFNYTNIYVGDINGDGFPDLIRLKPDGWTFQLNHGRDPACAALSPSSPCMKFDAESALIPGFAPNYSGFSPVYMLDVSGDGTTELILRDPVNNAFYTGFSLSDTYPPVLRPQVNLGLQAGDSFPVARRDWFLDLNGDGLPDSLSVELESGTRKGQFFYTAINTGNGFTSPRRSALFYALPSQPLWFFDYYGNGAQDIVYRDVLVGQTVLRVMPAGGAGQTLTDQAGNPLSVPTCQEPQASPCMWTFDVNGDGLTDLIGIVEGSIHVYTRQGTKGDLLTRINDRHYGTSVSYAPITSHATYATTVQPGVVASQQLLQGANTYVLNRGPWVVNSYVSDGPGSSPPTTYTYTYADARVGLSGRGWLGFASVTATNDQTGAVTTTTYDNATMFGSAYPYAFKPFTRTSEVSLAHTTVHYNFSATFYDVSGAADGSYITVLPSHVDEEESEGPPGNVSTFRSFGTDYSYDQYGNIKSITRTSGDGYVDAHRVQYTYNLPEWLLTLPTEITDTSSTPSGQTATRTTAFRPDPYAGGLNWMTIEPTGGNSTQEIFFYQLDAHGMATMTKAMDASQASPNIRMVTAKLDPLEDMFPVSETHWTSNYTFDHTAYFAFEPGLGVLGAIQDANGVITQWQYDGFGRLKNVSAPDGANIAITYSAATSSGSGVSTNSHYSNGRSLITNYDPRMFELEQSALGFNGQFVRTILSYDSQGHVAQRYGPCFRSSKTPCSSSRQRYSYDNLGRLTALTRSLGATSTWEYIGLRTNRHSFSRDGYTVEDQLGRVTQRVATIPGGNPISTIFTYEPFGLLHTVTDSSGNVTTMAHDVRGRTVSLNDPDLKTNSFQWNAFGELVQQTYANGLSTTNSWDELGRIQTTTDKDGTATFNWDTAANGIGKLASATSSDGVTTSYVYNSIGHVTGTTTQISGTAYNFGFSYDSVGRVETITYPSLSGQPFSIQAKYNPQGYLARIVNPNVVEPSFYQRIDLENEWSQPTLEDSGNHLRVIRTFDGRSLLTKLQVRGPLPATAVQQQIEYEYFPDRSLSSRTHSRIREEFKYDSLNRLQQWNVFDILQPRSLPQCWLQPVCLWGTLQEEFDYNDIGNLTKRTITERPAVGNPRITSTTQYIYQYAGADHAVTGINSDAYQYNAVGDQFIGPNRTVSYKAFNLPSRIATRSEQTTSFLYDASHQRAIKREPNGDTTVYVGRLYERRSQSGHVTEIFYVPGVGRLIGQVLRSAGTADRTFYFYDDALHSIQMVADERGNILEKLWFEPFGVSVDPSNLANHVTPPVGDVTVGFTGQYEDNDLGLINMKGRIYDPKIGRFLTPDPLVQDLRRSEALNRYSYAWNNPLKWIDPSGFQNDGGSEPDDGPQCDPYCSDGNGSGNPSQNQNPPDAGITYSQSSDWAGTTEQGDQSASDNGVFQNMAVIQNQSAPTQQQKAETPGPFPPWMTNDQQQALLNQGDFNRRLGILRLQQNLDPDTARPLPPRDPYTPYEHFVFAAGDIAKMGLLMMITAPLGMGEFGLLGGGGEFGVAGEQLEFEFAGAKGLEYNSGLVIGRGADLAAPGALNPAEYKLGWFSLQDQFGMGAEWGVNEERLRNVMSLGRPIRDASSALDTGGFYLNRERALLQSSGWIRQGDFWLPPIP